MIDAWLGHDERLEEVLIGGKKEERGIKWYFQSMSIAYVIESIFPSQRSSG